MREQRLRRIGALLVGAGAALLAGMVVVAMTLPVTGYATVQVWVAVLAVGSGPLTTGLIFLRSSWYQVSDRLGIPLGLSAGLTAASSAAVQDHYLKHPDAPVTVGAVAFGVIVVLSLALTLLPPLLITPGLGPEELRTRQVDDRGLRSRGRLSVALGVMVAAGFALTGLMLPVPVLDTALGVLLAGCSVVAGVLLTRITGLLVGCWIHRANACLAVVGFSCLLVASPRTYYLLQTSAVAGAVHFLLLAAGAAGLVLCAAQLRRFLGRQGVLPPSQRRPGTAGNVPGRSRV
jgi:hypothetical protein